MNIKVPYDKLGDLNSYQFVSLILDKKYQSIYREDIVNGENIKFYNYEQSYVVVPDEIYEQCDSVIFFPFSKNTNNWSTKVIMWKNEEFIKFNGGYEYIRNANKKPDIKKIESWLFAGKNTKISKKIVGKNNLIYFTLFGNNEYIFLQKLLLKSLAAQKYQDFDLLFITDSETKLEIKKIQELKKFNTYYHVIDSIKDPVDASMQKLKIYEWPDISKYKNILFLDADITVVGSMEKIFDTKKAVPNIFYSATHNKDQSLHSTVYHTLIDYTPYQLYNFSEKNITAFNAGQFFFKNTSTMQFHFKNINTFIKNWEGRYFFEQSFLNYYFNLLEIADTETFDPQFKFVSINENQTSNVFDDQAVIIHFMGNAGNAIGKIDFIKRHYNKFL